MSPLSTWENLFLGVFALLLIFWLTPGIKAALAKSKTVQADWPAVLVPLILVVLFALFLVGMVKS